MSQLTSAPSHWGLALDLVRGFLFPKPLPKSLNLRTLLTPMPKSIGHAGEIVHVVHRSGEADI